ncbi:BQ2448_2913 [Microbotryum intermedium]|uniref:BQ2448_2913 protein n=1 Tax=Microbotryum intermedium TaxID=269621 RepID=A0A238FDS9_9BASI|nr:BQ2448_2913 [Microbotryum intermedium]
MDPPLLPAPRLLKLNQRDDNDVSHSEAPGIPGFYAWVVVDGIDVPIYGARAEGNKVIGYIESMEGKPYVVKYRHERLEVSVTTDYNVEVFVDGKIQTTIRPFIFGKERLTDDNAAATSSKEEIENAGTIQVKILRSRPTAPSRLAPPPPPKVPAWTFQFFPRNRRKRPCRK